MEKCDWLKYVVLAIMVCLGLPAYPDDEESESLDAESIETVVAEEEENEESDDSNASDDSDASDDSEVEVCYPYKYESVYSDSLDISYTLPTEVDSTLQENFPSSYYGPHNYLKPYEESNFKMPDLEFIAKPLLFIAVAVVVLIFLFVVIGFLRGRISDKEKTVVKRADNRIVDAEYGGNLEEALAKQDYKEAIRIQYLRTLRTLSKIGQVNLNGARTPMEHFWGLKKSEYKEPMRKMTAAFLLAEYGDRDVDSGLYDIVESCCKEIKLLARRR